MLEAGPFRFEVVEPLERWRLDIHDDDHDISPGLDYESRCPPYFHRHVLLPGEYAGAIDQRHYTQSGRFHGRVRIDGQEYRELVGMKNRSWGIRSWHRLPMYHWTTAQSPDFSVT